jgi:diguanylate cyclase (GGDEF)-like protein
VYEERRADVFRPSPGDATPCDQELGVRDAVAFPLPGADEPLGVISWMNRPAGPFAEADLHNPSLRQFVAHAAFGIERARTTTRLRYLADYDQMTELVRRDRFAGAVRRGLQSLPGAYVHLAILDLDRFKRVNDRHGHLAGDEVIKQAAATIKRHAGPDVVVSHWGGDEFALALVADSAREGEEFAEGLRRAIGQATAAWSRDSGDHPVTASAGGATARRSAFDFDRLLRRADANLLRAKEQGRDRTVWAASEDAT